MSSKNEYTIWLADHTGAVFADHDEDCKDDLLELVDWLREFKSKKAQHLFGLINAGLYGQAARYYDINKF